jgi:hypothetical protein
MWWMMQSQQPQNYLAQNSQAWAAKAPMPQIHGSYVVGGFPTQQLERQPFLLQPELQYLSPTALAEIMELRRQREAVVTARDCGGMEGASVEERIQREAGLLPPEVPQQPSLKQRALALLGELLLLFLRELVGALGRYLPLLALGYLIHLQLLSVEELLQELLERLTGWFEKVPTAGSAALEVAETATTVESAENHSGSW